MILRLQVILHAHPGQTCLPVHQVQGPIHVFAWRDATLKYLATWAHNG